MCAMAVMRERESLTQAVTFKCAMAVFVAHTGECKRHDGSAVSTEEWKTVSV
jgi:hypothetical protein